VQLDAGETGLPERRREPVRDEIAGSWRKKVCGRSWNLNAPSASVRVPRRRRRTPFDDADAAS
jgi:hypothetical protein